jgi:hypothetical protein
MSQNSDKEATFLDELSAIAGHVRKAAGTLKSFITELMNERAELQDKLDALVADPKIPTPPEVEQVAEDFNFTGAEAKLAEINKAFEGLDAIAELADAGGSLGGAPIPPPTVEAPPDNSGTETPAAGGSNPIGGSFETGPGNSNPPQAVLPTTESGEPAAGGPPSGFTTSPTGGDVPPTPVVTEAPKDGVVVSDTPDQGSVENPGQGSPDEG